MIRLYFKQAWTLLRQERVFSLIYIVGTGLAASMIMALIVGMTILLTNIYPETHRDRLLIADYGRVLLEDGTQMFAGLSEKAIHTCFDGMEHVEAMAVVENFQTLGWLQPGDKRPSIEVNMRKTNADFWKVFDFRFLSGKPFSETDFQSGLPVAVISENLALQVFGKTDVVGQHISFDFLDYRVCGVVKNVSVLASLSYGDLWAPYTAYRPSLETYGNYETSGSLGEYGAYMLVERGVDLQKVKQDGQERVRRYSQTLGKGLTFWCMDAPDTFVEDFFHARNGKAVDYTAVWLNGLVLLLTLLLVPAINLSGMADSRMERRMAELGVRRAFGASRPMLFRQVIFENLLFTLLGGLLGLLVSYLLLVVCGDWFFKLLLDLRFPERGEVVLAPEMFFKPIAFIGVVAVCLVLNLVSALIPAWRASRRPIVESLSPMVGATMIGGRGMSFFTRVRKNAWIGLELMLVFVLLWMASEFGIMTGLTRMNSSEFKTDREWVVSLGVYSEAHQGYDSAADSPERRMEDFRHVLRRLEQYPDFDKVAVVMTYGGMPYMGDFHSNKYQNPRDTTRTFFCNTNVVYPKTDFFGMFGLETPDGKAVSMRDFDLSDPLSVVVSERLVKELYPDGNALGQTVKNVSSGQDLRIVGIVKDLKRTDYEIPQGYCFRGTDIADHLESEDLPVFVVHLKEGVSERNFEERFIETMSDELRFGNFYLKQIKSYRQIRTELNEEFGYLTLIRFGVVMSLFFLLNVILCVIGMFWYRVRLRREEIGLRMAMGADKRRIRRMLFKEGLMLLAVASLPAMLIESQLILAEVITYAPETTRLLIGSPVMRFVVTNAVTWAILALAIICGIWLPANRAVKYNPADALHDE